MQQQQNTHWRVLALTIVISLLLGQALPALAQEAEPVAPPALTQVTPAGGTSWGGEAVVWVFDRSVAGENFVVTPEIAGEWTVMGRVVTFAAAELPDPEGRYRFRFDARAADSDGAPQPGAEATPIELALLGATPLLVTATQPTHGATEVGIDGTIVVSFNRPVVPLTSIEEQEGLPQPVNLVPPVEGTGRWLTTSIYTFEPTLGLAGATDYTVVVDPLTAVGGEAMAEPFFFDFSTTEPIVADYSPQGTRVGPDAAVRLTFSQPMDRASTEDAFDLYLANSDIVMSGEVTWNEASTTLTFTPTEPLPFGESFQIVVENTALPASLQGTLRERFVGNFATVPLPAISTMTPADGSDEASPEQLVIITFNAPLSRTTLMENITIAPLLTNTVVYSYYNEWDGQLILDWNKQANTTYEVTIGADVQDLYGNTLGEETTLSFTTGDFTPFVRVELEQFTQFTPISDTYVSLIYRNMNELEVALLQLPIEEFVDQFNGENAWDVWQNYDMPDRDANLLWTQVYTATETRNESYQRVVTLADDEGNRLAPGLYLLEATLPVVPRDPNMGPAPTVSRHVILISNQNIVVKKSMGGDSLAWVTDIVSGEAVEGQEVAFYAPENRLGETVTDADGVARAALDMPPETSWLPLIAIVGEPGDANFAVGTSNWYSGIAGWDFGINSGYTLDEWQSVFYTDRPIYRPGQTVFWKGIVRRLVGDDFLLPEPSQTLTITVRNDRGDTIFEQNMPTSAMGTLDGRLELAPDAFTGFYYLDAQTLDARGNIRYIGSLGFQVAAYEKPEFEVSLTPAQDEYSQGDTIEVTLQADYFSGGALANAPLTWRVIAEPYSFFWADAPDGRWFSFDPFDPENERFDPYRGIFSSGLVKEGTGETDGDGAFTLELPADLGSALQSQRWVVDMTVQSPTNQFVTTNRAIPVHRGAFYVGLSPQRYVDTVGSESAVDVVTVAPQGETVGGVDVEITGYEFRWNNVQERTANGRFVWTSTFERVPAFSDRVQTDADGTATVRWTPQKAGQYQIVAEAEDEAGNAISSAVFLYVSSPDPTEFTSWRRDNNDRIELVADKRLYAPGETAQVLVPSPFAGEVTALVTLEQSDVNEARVLTLEGTSETIDVPITPEMIPNTFLSVILVKGIDETNPTPAIRVGLVQLNVDIAEKELTLDVEVTGGAPRAPETAPTAEDEAQDEAPGTIPPSGTIPPPGGPPGAPDDAADDAADDAPSAEPAAQTFAPGDPVTYTLTVRDSEGRPVEGAEVSVALVDKALMTLVTGGQTPLLESFYRERPLGVTTGATLIINRDRVSQQLGDGAKGGGGGGDGMFAVREEFPDTAFWRAALVSDADGLITFALELPDNLTTWQLFARAVTAETRVGETTHDLVVTKDLQVRPILPRFFTAADRAEIGALILNTTAIDAQDGTFVLDLEGAVADGEQEIAFDLAGGASTTFRIPVVVASNTDAVTVTMRAEAGNLGDAVRLVLPVLRYRSPETVATSGVVDPEGRSESILVPAAAGDEGELLVLAQPSLAAGLVPALAYLEEFPYECTEQTVSRFLPNLATAHALAALGIEEAALEENVAQQVNVGVQKLVNRQNADGGWGYWPGEESYAFITAYVLWGLWQADEGGFVVPAHTLERAVNYLDRLFVAPSEVRQAWQLSELAFVHFVLSEVGEGDPGRMSTLYDVRERLQNYAKALLAMAMHNVEPEDARISTLLDDLVGSAALGATGAWWQEPTVHWETLNTDIRSTAIILRAFVRIAPEQPLLPNVVRWLMSARNAGVWANTQENAWSILALTDWMEATGELEGDFDFSVALNGEATEATVTPETVRESLELRTPLTQMLRDEANLLRFERGAGPGQLYYSASLGYSVDALDVAPLDRGIVVDRHFEMAGSPITQARVGDIFSATVTVVAPTSLVQVRVDVPIPAGTELVDPSLATMPQYDEFGNPIQRFDWAAWYPTYKDFRDDRVALFDTFMEAGTYQYTFHLRATVPGEYSVLPAHAEMMYFTDVWGRSAGAAFRVVE